MSKIFEIIIRETGGLAYIYALSLILAVVAQTVMLVRYFVLKQNTRKTKEDLFASSIVSTFLFGVFWGCCIGVELIMGSPH